jgi:SET domain-containing protein
MPSSYRSPRTAVRPSPIHGRGLFAARPIRAGDVVAIKGGHVLDAAALRRVRSRVAASYIQVGDGFYLGAASRREVARNKLWLNHSCEPNVGIRGEITFVAMRAVAAGEELTYDWAMEENAPARTRCRCGSPRCRKWLTGRDWRRPELRRRYRGFFSAYLADKIRRLARDSGRSRR